MGNYIPAKVDVSNLSFNYIQRGQDWAEGSNPLEQSSIDIVPNAAKSADDLMRLEVFLNDSRIPMMYHS